MLRSFLIVFLVVLSTNFRLAAESLYPVLSRTSIYSLRLQLKNSQMVDNRLNLLLLLGESFCGAYEEFELPADLDTASMYISQAQPFINARGITQEQIRSTYIHGLILIYQGSTVAGKNEINKAIQLSKQQGFRQLEADGWFNLSYAYTRADDELPGKLKSFEHALYRYRQLGQRKKEALTRQCIAEVHFLQGKNNQAIQEYQQVLAIYQSIGYHKQQYVCNLLASVYRKIGNYKEALRFGLTAIKCGNATRDTSLLGYLYNRVGIYYEDLHQPQNALIYMEKGLGYAKKTNQNSQVLSLAVSVSRNMLALNKPREALDFLLDIAKEYPPDNDFASIMINSDLGTCYLATRQYTLANSYYQKALSLLETKKPIKGDFLQKIAFSVNQNLGKLYLTTNQYKKARDYLTIALGYKPEQVSLANLAEIHLNLFKADSAQANFSGAINHYQFYKKINDSIFNETRSKQIEELQVQYETREKEQNIQQLKSQNILQLKQAKQYKTVTLIGILLLLIIIGLLYNQYRIKQRSNQQLEVKQEVISQKNDSLQQLVKEKEWLLKEIHHRVKNNLHTITSLLESQSAFLQDDALAAIRDSQHRVFAMSLIHQKLYLSDNLAAINMTTYLHELVSYLRDSFDTPGNIRFELDVAPIELEVSQAVPLGLILNEAITNALKYAFPEERSGRIKIAMRQVSADEVELVVADNGIGLPVGFGVLKSRSLGMQLMMGLSEDIGAKFHIENNHGTRISIQFTLDRMLKNVQPATG